MLIHRHRNIRSARAGRALANRADAFFKPLHLCIDLSRLVDSDPVVSGRSIHLSPYSLSVSAMTDGAECQDGEDSLP